MSSPVVTPKLPNKSLPETLRCGDTLTWDVQTKLAVGYTVFYVFTQLTRASAPARIQIAPVAVGADGTAIFTVAGTVSGAWTPGRYEWIAFSVDADGNRTQIASDQVILQPDPAGINPVDLRTHNEKVLEQIKCLIEGKTLDDVQIYKIGGRELTKILPMDLLKMQGIYEARVRNERIRRGQYVPKRTLGITFGDR